MNQNAWFEHFKEQLQGLTESYESAGSSLSLLGYALTEKRLSSEEYLNWAANHHKLPKLQSRFFTETPLSQEMFAKWATHYRWSVECLPVAEWDGALIVVCLEPPQDFPSFPKAVLVLAEMESIQIAWNAFHPVQNNSSQTISSQVPSAQIPSTKKPSDSFSFDDLGVEESQPLEQASAPSEVLDDTLVGLFESSNVVKLETLGASPMPVIPAPPSPEVNPDALFVEKPTPAVKAPPPAPEDAKPTLAPSLSPAVPAASKPIVNTATAATFALEKLKKKNLGLITERIKSVLGEMKIYFEKSMIFTLDEQETQLVAFAWDESFQGIKDTNMRFPLKKPSIFNIVASTQKPFHGYVSLNEINEKFFDDWNQGKVPDHVTITPILVGEKMVGMLVGFADKSAYNKTTLNLAEKLSQQFVKDLQVAS